MKLTVKEIQKKFNISAFKADYIHYLLEEDNPYRAKLENIWSRYRFNQTYNPDFFKQWEHRDPNYRKAIAYVRKINALRAINKSLEINTELAKEGDMTATKFLLSVLKEYSKLEKELIDLDNETGMLDELDTDDELVTDE
jgi:hypothetical protein